MNEASLQRKCIKNAKARGWLAYKFASPSHRGVPDVLFIRGGEVKFVEFKHPNGKGKVSKLQQKTIFDMTNNGAKVKVIKDEETFNAFIS